jgi:rhodanese-related sulfurtransferase
MIKNCALLLLIACVPAAIQLIRHGQQPPPDNPYLISVTGVANKKPVLWIDARTEGLFKERHIPDAINLNRSNWDQAIAQLFEHFEPGMTVVTYCSSGCQESEQIAARIRELGIEPVLILDGGFEAWVKKH